jgi:hypothetical protein
MNTENQNTQSKKLTTQALSGPTNSNSMNTIARLVTRSANADNQVDLILGAAIRNSGVLQPNTIYEIQEYLGNLIFVKIGPSAIKNSGPIDPKTSHHLGLNWGNDVNWILDYGGDKHLLTEDELIRSIDSN